MAQARRGDIATAAPMSDDIHDPGVPDSEMQPVNPMIDEPTEGLSTMKDFFPGTAEVVDEVRQTPMEAPEDAVTWVIRPSTKIEDMTDGVPIVHMSFDPGVRYRVPKDVARILWDRDLLMEIPFPFDPSMRR